MSIRYKYDYNLNFYKQIIAEYVYVLIIYSILEFKYGIYDEGTDL